MQNMECLESAQRALTDLHWPNALRTFQLPTSWDAVKRVTAWAVVDVVSHWCHTAPCRPAALCTPSVLGVRRCHQQSPALWWGDQPSQACQATIPVLWPFKSFPSLCSFSSLLKSSSQFFSAASFESPESQSAKTSAKGFKGRISIFHLYIPKWFGQKLMIPKTIKQKLF